MGVFAGRGTGFFAGEVFEVSRAVGAGKGVTGAGAGMTMVAAVVSATAASSFFSIVQALDRIRMAIVAQRIELFIE